MESLSLHSVRLTWIGIPNLATPGLASLRLDSPKGCPYVNRVLL